MSDSVRAMFEKLPIYWKLATFRCALYSILVGWGAFEAGVEGYNALSEMTSLQKIKLAGGIMAAIIGVVLAFLDNTLTKVQPEKSGDSTLSVTATATIQPKIPPMENIGQP